MISQRQIEKIIEFFQQCITFLRSFINKIHYRLDNSFELGLIILLMLQGNTAKPKFAGLKITLCTSVSVSCIFFAAIFILQAYFNNEISLMVQDQAVLTDLHSDRWAICNGSSISTYSNVLTIGSQIASLDIRFKYANLTFQQGNSGQLKYINVWEKVPSSVEPGQVIALNQGLLAVYGYDSLAPFTRYLPVMFNRLLASLQETFLPAFYSNYLYRYILSDKELIKKSVFSSAGLSPEQQKCLYEDKEYGWGNPQTLSWWMRAILKNDKNLKQILRDRFELTRNHIETLTDSTSLLYELVESLNATMKAKLGSYKSYSVECAGEYCSGEELLAAQLGVGFLTTEELFPGLKLDSSIQAMNTTIRSPVELVQFCRVNPDLVCPNATWAINLFLSGAFSQFTKVASVMANRENPSLVETILSMPQGTGQGILLYLDYLFDKVLLGKTPKAASTLSVSISLQGALSKFSQVLLVELYSRAYYEAYSGLKCAEYFTDSFKDFNRLCSDLRYNFSNPLESIRRYISSALLFTRPTFLNETGMQDQEAYMFLKGSSESIFSNNLRSIMDSISKFYACADNPCLPQELVAREWGGEKPILSSLPPLFRNRNVTITSWDYEGLLKGFEPQYWKQENSTIELSVALRALSSGFDGFFNHYNIIDGSVSTKYAFKTVAGIQFGGLYIKSTLCKLLEGEINSGVELRRSMKVSEGGVPWLASRSPLVELSHKAEDFSFINSGLYDRNKLRNISQHEGKVYSSGTYIVYSDPNNTITERLLTNKAVGGTNCFGFKTGITKKDRLSCFIELVGASIQFVFDGDVKDDSYSLSMRPLMFKLPSDSVWDVSAEQTRVRAVRLNAASTYLKVEPLTGLTLQHNISYAILEDLSTFGAGWSSSVQGFLYYHLDDTSTLTNISSLLSTQDTWFVLNITFASIAFIAACIFFAALRLCQRRYFKKSSLINSQSGVGLIE